MSEAKRLTPETLEENLAFVRAAVGPGLTDEIRGHIAALMTKAVELYLARASAQVENDAVRVRCIMGKYEPVSTRAPHFAALDRIIALAQRAEQAEMERDEARRSADELQRQRDSRGDALEVMEQDRDTWKRLYESGKGWASAEDLSKARKERDAAQMTPSAYVKICADALDGVVAGTPEDAARLAREYAETRQEAERLAQHIRLDAEHVTILRRDLGAEEMETLRGVAMRLKQEVEALRARVAELEANTIALTKAGGEVIDRWIGGSPEQPALDRFAQLLARHRPGAALLAAHAKALRRARNEGREGAARWFEIEADALQGEAGKRPTERGREEWAEQAQVMRRHAERIRSWKEPE